MILFNKCKTCCNGGLSPVKATDEMTQPVGQRHGQLFTEPGGADIHPVEATEEMIQPVGVRDGKLFTDPLGGTVAHFQMKWEQFALKDSITEYRNMRINFDFREFIGSVHTVRHSISVDEDGNIYYDDAIVGDSNGFYNDDDRHIMILSEYVDTRAFLVLTTKADYELQID